MELTVTIRVLCALAVLRGVKSYRNGAPLEQCDMMQPGVDEHGEEQTSESVYEIYAYSDTVEAGDLLIRKCASRHSYGDPKG